MSDLSRLKNPLQQASQEAERAYFAAGPDQEDTLLKIVENIERAQQLYDFLVRTTKNNVAPISRDRGDVAVKTGLNNGAVKGPKGIRFGIER